MSKIKYIILNGPPRSGKSILARELTAQLSTHTLGGATKGVMQDAFAVPLKHFFAVAMGDKFSGMDKEKARPELNGYSLRESWIDLAENYIKKRFGDDVFGRWLVHRSLRHPTGLPLYYIVDDGGFVPEIDAVPKPFIVHVSRAGTSFQGDSRRYYPICHAAFDNDGNLSNLWTKAVALAKEIRSYEA